MTNPNIPAREGSRPKLSTEGPQTQLTDRSTPEIWGRLVATATALPGVVEGHSQVSPASSRALFLENRAEHISPETSLAPEGRLEPIHLHGVHDTSLHLTLPKDRAAEITELGWGEPHQYEDFGTEAMIYGPRNDAELRIVLSLIEESLRFARGE